MLFNMTFMSIMKHLCNICTYENADGCRLNFYSKYFGVFGKFHIGIAIAYHNTPF